LQNMAENEALSSTRSLALKEAPGITSPQSVVSGTASMENVGAEMVESECGDLSAVSRLMGHSLTHMTATQY